MRTRVPRARSQRRSTRAPLRVAVKLRQDASSTGRPLSAVGPRRIIPAMKTGTEWLIDAAGCDPALLADLGAMRGLCDAVVADLGLCSIGEPRWHQFPFPGGVTGMYLLTESHLTCHSFPELRAATF